MTTSAKIRPVHVVRMGRVKAAIWQNETQSGIHHNVSVTRSYRDGEQWKVTSSFGRDDLPLVVKVIDRAHDWIFENSPGSANSDFARKQDS